MLGMKKGEHTLWPVLQPPLLLDLLVHNGVNDLPSDGSVKEVEWGSRLLGDLGLRASPHLHPLRIKQPLKDVVGAGKELNRHLDRL